MAQGKKSFIAYSDWKDIFDELPNEDAGKLIKHIFAYVNDENPVSDSILIKAVFANIKATLKRDLIKWDKQLEQRKMAGTQSAISRKNKSTKTNERSTVVNETERNSTDSVNVSVSVNDILLEKETKDIFTFDDFWKDYPKKVDKEKCRLKFNKLKASEIILISKTLNQFISFKPFKEYNHPNPLTYLNGKRWNDEIPKSENKTIYICEYGNALGKDVKNHTEKEIEEYTKSGFNKLLSKKPA